MELLVFYAGNSCTGRIHVNVNKTEINCQDFNEIEKTLKEKLFNENLIITNIIKLPIQ